MFKLKRKPKPETSPETANTQKKPGRIHTVFRMVKHIKTTFAGMKIIVRIREKWATMEPRAQFITLIAGVIIAGAVLPAIPILIQHL